MEVCKSQRLTIRQFNHDDAEFILRLFNEQTFIESIGDKKVRDISGAVDHLINGPMASYEKYGFGLYLVSLTDSNTPIGMCGLLQRGFLNYPDIGYALLPEFAGQGYAKEASQAVLESGHKMHGLGVVGAFTAQENTKSNRLLKKLGFKYVGLINYLDSENNLYEYRFK